MNTVKVTIVEILEKAWELPNGMYKMRVIIDCWGSKKEKELRINSFDVPKYIVGYSWAE